MVSVPDWEERVNTNFGFDGEYGYEPENIDTTRFESGKERRTPKNSWVPKEYPSLSLMLDNPESPDGSHTEFAMFKWWYEEVLLHGALPFRMRTLGGRGTSLYKFVVDSLRFDGFRNSVKATFGLVEMGDWESMPEPLREWILGLIEAEREQRKRGDEETLDAAKGHADDRAVETLDAAKARVESLRDEMFSDGSVTDEMLGERIVQNPAEQTGAHSQSLTQMADNSAAAIRSLRTQLEGFQDLTVTDQRPLAGTGVNVNDRTVSLRLHSGNGLELSGDALQMSLATPQTAGAMSAADKQRLGVAFRFRGEWVTPPPESWLVGDIITFQGLTYVCVLENAGGTLPPNAPHRFFPIGNFNSLVTSSVAGLMSAADKVALDDLRSTVATIMLPNVGAGDLTTNAFLRHLQNHGCLAVGARVALFRWDYSSNGNVTFTDVAGRNLRFSLAGLQIHASVTVAPTTTTGWPNWDGVWTLTFTTQAPNDAASVGMGRAFAIRVSAGGGDDRGTVTELLGGDLVPVGLGGTGRSQVNGPNGIMQLLTSEHLGEDPPANLFFPAFTGSWARTGHMSTRQLRDRLGLGDSLGPLAIENGGTGRDRIMGRQGILASFFPEDLAQIAENLFVAGVTADYARSGSLSLHDLRNRMGLADVTRSFVQLGDLGPQHAVFSVEQFISHLRAHDAFQGNVVGVFRWSHAANGSVQAPGLPDPIPLAGAMVEVMTQEPPTDDSGNTGVFSLRIMTMTSGVPGTLNHATVEFRAIASGGETNRWQMLARMSDVESRAVMGDAGRSSDPTSQMAAAGSVTEWANGLHVHGRRWWPASAIFDAVNSKADAGHSHANLISDQPIGLLTPVGAAQQIRVGSLLVSNDFTHGNLVPANGAYIRGDVLLDGTLRVPNKTAPAQANGTLVATEAQVALRANIASPTFTGVPRIGTHPVAVAASTANAWETNLPIGSYILVSNSNEISVNESWLQFWAIRRGNEIVYTADPEDWEARILSGSWRISGAVMHPAVVTLARRVA